MEQKQVEAPALKMDPKLRRTAMINSGVLAVQFGFMGFICLKVGSTGMALVSLFSTIMAVNDTLTFYYINKGN